MSSRKRKRPRRESQNHGSSNTWAQDNDQHENISESLFVEAHEATIIRNRPDLAKAINQRSEEGRSRLIKLGDGSSQGGKPIWVDRFDARLLIDFPGPSSSSSRRAQDKLTIPSSPTGWSDIPSDSEETFFMNREEVEEMRWQKRRKMLDTAMEDRVRAMEEAELNAAQHSEATQQSWQGDDEEPEDTTKTLMERTASHLVASPNSAQLEMRILANHGIDPRFAFLRGRWKNAWQRIKAAAQIQKNGAEREVETAEEETVTKSPAATATGLVAYGSDSD